MVLANLDAEALDLDLALAILEHRAGVDFSEEKSINASTVPMLHAAINLMPRLEPKDVDKVRRMSEVAPCDC
jgi:hypothetical protein